MNTIPLKLIKLILLTRHLEPAPLIIKQIPVGTMANFVYLVVDARSREALVVDSGWETEPILRSVQENGAKTKYVVATHEHFDHVSTLHELANALGAEVVCHESSGVEGDLRVRDNDELRLGNSRVMIMHTPGHTADSMCLYDGVDVFTGDTLFVGTIGKFDRRDSEAMFRSLHRLLRLPSSTMMYPGHDYGEVPSRTLGEEKSLNPFLVPSDFRSFVSLFG